jgi:alkanesulfonate monooxygenase SsuD/methylene tetrahydromethanopterin reductase-like flavin-dependent oxidoreductase (luciferase family)
VERTDRVLHIGVGTSSLHENMVDDGYLHLDNLDYAKEAIDSVKARWNARYDLCRLPQHKHFLHP